MCQSSRSKDSLGHFTILSENQQLLKENASGKSEIFLKVCDRLARKMNTFDIPLQDTEV